MAVFQLISDPPFAQSSISAKGHAICPPVACAAGSMMKILFSTRKRKIGWFEKSKMFNEPC
jgi:hypothetical protein